MPQKRQRALHHGLGVAGEQVENSLFLLAENSGNSAS
jgi:hypothetical protein